MEEIRRCFVYKHIRLDTNEVFYIGKGTYRLRDTKNEVDKFRRAYDKGSRSDFWKHIVNKAGYRVEIIEFDLTDEEAFEKEIYWIAFYGRRDLDPTKPLCNLDNGGVGSKSGVKQGRPMSEASKENLRRQNLGKPRKGCFYALITPDNELITGYNFKTLSKAIGISVEKIGKLMSGKIKVFKGYQAAFPSVDENPQISKVRKPRRVTKFSDDRIYKIFDPEGNIHEFSNRIVFARENNLDTNSLRKVLSGIQHCHKGWSLERVTSKIYQLLSPDGELFIFDNMETFAKENGLHESCLSRVLSGESSHHRGWHQPNVTPFNKTKFPKIEKGIAQINEAGQTIREFTSIKDASTVLNLDPCAISKVCHKKIPNIDGFMFVFLDKDINKRVKRQKIKIAISKDGERVFEGGMIECAKFLGVEDRYFRGFYKNGKYKEYKIEVI